ncbi:leucine-rich repeat-containing protein 15-like [Harpegnathos saltator]|uniref:leucine-rich repeat-containing protein 15-like n=1 Tax=Harpegnathos saltator TaxID=610380 RepID=UPI000DBEEB9A|nr:leucine-rich repeat-containing protein 15-like [Harpegnathos saltator]
MMIKFVLLLLLGHCLANASKDELIQTISVSNQYKEKYDMKIPFYEQIPCETTDTLRLEGMVIRSITDDLIQSDTIRHISFRNNSLRNIPMKVLNRVQHLTCLDLSINNINLHNNNFIQHHTLRVLDLSYQKPEFTDWSKSEVEDLKQNKKPTGLVNFITTNIYLPNLEHLLLNGNYIWALSDTFNASFPKLSHLYLNNINAKEINLELFNIIPKTLRVLYLENNYLSNFSLQNMAEIKELHLNGNPLKNIEIISNYLQILLLSDGAAKGNINLRTPNLEYLDLSNNDFYVDYNMRYDNLKFLKTLLLDYNKFSRFPPFAYTSLIKLSLSYNMITYIIPKYFEHLTFLEKLSLKGNYIKHVETDSFMGLNRLEYLDLSENQIKQLPYDWTSKLTNLRFLNVSFNHFEKISDLSISSFSSISHVFVKNNKFTEITVRELNTLPTSITVYLN